MKSKPIRVAGMGRRGPLPGKRRKVVQWVRGRIATGELRPGDRLPDRQWFVERFKLTPPTVQLAFDELKADGLVRAAHRHGTRVVDRLPFVGRFLLLLKARGGDAGSQIFPEAMKAAAASFAAARGVRFDVRYEADAVGESEEYAETLEAVRRQRYEGVLAQGVTDGEHGLDTIANVDEVPIAYFGVRSELTQGSLAVPLPVYTPWFVRELLKRHFEECVANGLKRVAVFLSDHRAYLRLDVPALAAEYGLKMEQGGFHVVDMFHWNRVQFKRLASLFLSAPVGERAQAVVLGDDNLLLPFVEAHRDLFGRAGDGRHLVFCHCNFPLMPKTDFPVRFHGLDLDAIVANFADYARACRNGDANPEPPTVTLR